MVWGYAAAPVARSGWPSKPRVLAGSPASERLSGFSDARLPARARWRALSAKRSAVAPASRHVAVSLQALLLEGMPLQRKANVCVGSDQQ